MKPLSGLILLGTLLTAACAEDPVIQMQGFQSQPILYSIIETRDSAHFIRIGRLFAGNENPGLTSRIPDSIYFDSVKVKVTLTSMWGEKEEVPVEGRMVGNKDDGFFDSGDYMIYWFYKHISIGYYPEDGYMQFYSKILIEASCPGLPVARCSADLVAPPKINSPKRAQQFVFLTPENPIRVQWYGGDWNEIAVNFTIWEEYPDSTVSRTFHIYKGNGLLFNVGTPQQYCELKVPYEMVVQILGQNLIYRTDIIRRYFGAFRIEVNTGNIDFDIFRQFIGGMNDFNFNPYDNIENGIGILSSKSTTIKDPVYLDYASRIYLANEPKLAKFRFIEY